MNTHIPGANVSPMIRSPTTVEAWDIQLASGGNHTCSTAMTYSEKITTEYRRTGDGIEAILVDTVTPDPTTETGKTTTVTGKTTTEKAGEIATP